MTAFRFAFSLLALGLLAVPVAAATRPPLAKPDAGLADSAVDLAHRAEAAEARGDMDLALRLAQAAIVADPAKPQGYDLLADLYAGEGQSDFARFYYNEALGIDPGDSGAGRGIAQLDHGGSEQAAEAAPPAK